MPLFWHRDAYLASARLATRKFQNFCRLFGRAIAQNRQATIDANVGQASVTTNDLRYRSHFAAAQALTANDEIAQVIEQAVVDVVFGNRSHDRAPGVGSSIFEFRRLIREAKRDFGAKLLTSRGFGCDAVGTLA